MVWALMSTAWTAILEMRGGQLVRAQLSLPQPAPDQIRISNSGLLKWAEKNNTKIKMFLLFTVMRIQIRPGLN